VRLIPWFKNQLSFFRSEYPKILLQLGVALTFCMFCAGVYFMFHGRWSQVERLCGGANLLLLCWLGDFYMKYYVENSRSMALLLRSAATEESHEKAMYDIKKFFSNRWLAKSEKSKILMDVDNLRLLVYPKLADSRECIEQRDQLFVDLMQQYLSNDQIQKMLCDPMILGRRKARNIFGWLAKERNLKLMQKFFAIPGLELSQKYNAFMNTSAERPNTSVLLIATASLPQEGSIEMIHWLVKASAIFTREQKFALLMQNNEEGCSPLDDLTNEGEHRLANFLMKNLTDFIETGAVVYQLGIQKNIPTPLLYNFISFAALPNSHSQLNLVQWSMDLYQTGLKKAKELRLNRA